MGGEPWVHAVVDAGDVRMVCCGAWLDVPSPWVLLSFFFGAIEGFVDTAYEKDRRSCGNGV